jgi:uncharacterized protein
VPLEVPLEMEVRVLVRPGQPSREQWRSLLFGLLIAAAGMGVTAAALLLNARTGVLERGFVYFPSSSVHSTPADVGLAYEEVSLVASDGVRVEGWFVPGPRSVTLLWFHGNAGNIADRVHQIRTLHDELGVSVFILSYRGYGRSEGRPSEAGLYRDAQAALDHLLARPDVDAGRIVYFGRSVGSAIAVDLAVQHPPHALILEGIFPSLRWMAGQVYPWLPVGRFLHQEFDAAAKAPLVDAPSLVIHGDRDEIVPLAGGRAVAEALAGDVELYVVPGARHNDVPHVGGDAYYRTIESFLERVSPR